MRAAALLVLAACSTAPAPLPSHAVSRAAPSTPPPEVAFANMQLVATGLPAIAADGRLVVHTVIDGDGGRGNPNLALVVRDRNDREIERFVVVTANESEGQFDEHGPSPALAAKLAAANTRLASLHDANDLRPLTSEHLVVDLGARLTVRARGTVVVDVATPAKWSSPDKPMCSTCREACAHPMFLGGAHANIAHTIVLVTVSYTGTDLCPEPVSEHHVITW